ncbi:MAG: hypothetical protein N2322_00935 [Terrimicrobiaceae bacterium]|nr:hypothetical protein [Terrimicrobiaceae bacterium]
MKTPALFAIVSGALLLTGLAQEETSPQPPPPPPLPPGPGGPSVPPNCPEGPPPGPEGRFRDALRERWMSRLSPEERRRFEEARRKALEDPKIAELRQRAEAANREFFEAMRKKMNEIDPGIEDLVRKGGRDERRKEKDGKDGKDGKRFPGWNKEGGKGLGSLSEDERQKLAAAREIARQTASVQAAERKRAEATTPEERRQAAIEHAQAMKEAILAADPSLAPILEKLHPGALGKPD